MNLSLAAAIVLTGIVIATIAWNIWPERKAMHDLASLTAKSRYKGIVWNVRKIDGWGMRAPPELLDFLVFDGFTWMPPAFDHTPPGPKTVGIYFGDNFVLAADPPVKEIGMSFKELSDAILKLSDADQASPVVVWPPEGCPAAEAVPVVALLFSTKTSKAHKVPMLSTGKTP